MAFGLFGKYLLSQSESLRNRGEKFAVISTCLGISTLLSVLTGSLLTTITGNPDLFVYGSLLAHGIFSPLLLFIGTRLWDLIRTKKPSFQEKLVILDALRDEYVKTTKKLSRLGSTEEFRRMIDLANQQFFATRKLILTDINRSMNYSNEIEIDIASKFEFMESITEQIEYLEFTEEGDSRSKSVQRIIYLLESNNSIKQPLLNR